MRKRIKKVRRVVYDDIVEHQCEYCGTWFGPCRADAEYCKASCRVLAHKKRKVRDAQQTKDMEANRSTNQAAAEEGV